MKIQAKNELRQLTVTELTKKIGEMRRQITEEQLKKATGETKKVHLVWALRQKLVVAMSILREKDFIKKE